VWPSIAAGLLALCVPILGPSGRIHAQDAPSDPGRRLYDAIRTFALTGGSLEVNGLTLTRDRVDLTFTGTFYFAGPIDGRVTGAVFLGQGTMKALPPDGNVFERDNLRRLINADLVESDFKSAVLRFTDDTAARLEGARRETPVPPAAQKLASEFDPRFTMETGANLPARLALSILDAETPGVFVAQFDGGRRGRFSVVLDQQTRIPVANFRIDAGERGLIFAFQQSIYGNDVWTAFHSLEDYTRGTANYSDANDLVDVLHYRLELDLRQLDKRIGLVARMQMQVKGAGVRAIPFTIGEGLSNYQETRLRRQMRVKAARVGGTPAAFAQEDWEGGFTVFLPAAVAAGQPLEVEVDLDGDFMSRDIPESFYPISNTDWYPRHGNLDRASFDLVFRHRSRDRIASVGQRISEKADPEDKKAMITQYRMPDPVALVVFAVAPFERKTQQVKWENGGAPIPIEVNSMPARLVAIKDDFILAELDNAIQYFAAIFGRYPYQSFGAAFHPFGFGQGFPTLLMIPPTDRANKGTYSFMAHETAHQWWGNIVLWRTYRDQWLSEGFAEYSGVLYTGKRDLENPKAASELIRAMRDSLREPPAKALGVGKGRLNDIGPVSLGLRLNNSQSFGYQALVYNKGALVLRMLHYLLSNPAAEPSSDPGSPFFAMMSDFVERYRNKSASTAEFRKVAGEHFARSPIGQKYGLANLDWFFQQWVDQTPLPTYDLEYSLKDEADKSVIVTGTLTQDGVGNEFFMALPIVFTFDGNQTGRTVVRASGPSSTFELKLPARPKKVELDPASWILSEKTATKSK
jgi:hypothetical protein